MTLPAMKRFHLFVVCLFLMIGVAVAALKQEDQPTQRFRIVFGLRDRKSTDWTATLSVAGGQVESLAGWRFGERDAILGVGGWQCRTHEYPAPDQRVAIKPAEGMEKAPIEKPFASGVDLVLKGDDAKVNVRFRQGELSFSIRDIKLGEPLGYLDGQVAVERLPVMSIFRPAQLGGSRNARQDDYPAFWVQYRTGIQFLAWVVYQHEKDRIFLAKRQGPDGAWSEPMEVAGPGDHFRVELAGIHGGDIWIVWSGQHAGNWDLFGRKLHDGVLGPEKRLTENAGSDIWHCMTTDNHGRAWLVWQGFRDGRAQIFARFADAEGWRQPVILSEGTANCWNPVIAADTKTDRLWVSWDGYAQGNYRIFVRAIGTNAALGPILCPADNGLFNAHPSLACDREGRLWVAWDESGEQWGKDSGFQLSASPGTRLYASRRIRIRCWINDRWEVPVGDFTASLPDDMKSFNELPKLQVDSNGRMWIAYRHRYCKRPRIDGWAAQGRWDAFATAFLGDRWLAPIPLPDSGGRNDMRISAQRDPTGSVYFAYATDNRGWVPPQVSPRNLSIAVTRLQVAASKGLPVFAATGPLGPAARQPDAPLIHPREKDQVARVRGYTIKTAGHTYHIFRGDLHRHTDISIDGSGDGTVMDLHRYAMDAAALDFIMVTDHNMGDDNEYSWWTTQKANDLYTNAGSFISMYGYERSIPYPNGHRNVIWTERGHRTLPAPRPPTPANMAADTQRIYADLRQSGGICTLHSSATSQGTDWRDHDEGLEPFVEIFQGYHTSYEAPGAPRAADEHTDLVHGPYRPKGFVSLALAKGYHLGFQASSDHISTHISYTCVLAEEFSRKGLVDAMKRRHTYAATDNIVLDVRMGALGIMGDRVQSSKPQLDVVALGTGPIDRVDVIRNGTVVFTAAPKTDSEEARFHWVDPSPNTDGKESYYYTRVIQKDRQMAWSSPIWVGGD
jgi:hypothetical protein